MINVRVQMMIVGGEWWTSAIHNPAALQALTKALTRGHVRHAVYDDFGHANIADGCLAIAERLGGGHAPVDFFWGDGRYRCRVAPLPRASGVLAPRRRRRDQQKAAKEAKKNPPSLPLLASVQNCGDDELPRELRGPTAEEVAQSTPLITARALPGAGKSHTEARRHGETNRNPPSVSPVPLCETFWDRLLAWVTGVPRGQAVHGEGVRS